MIGGLAAVLQGSPVFTQDVDICPDRSHENLVRLSRALSSVEARIRTDEVPDGLPFANGPWPPNSHFPSTAVCSRQLVGLFRGWMVRRSGIFRPLSELAQLKTKMSIRNPCPRIH